jgi:D-arginine dehydrogenase
VSDDRFDVAIAGAGIAGASLAWHLAPRLRVLLLEREAQPGSHSTGRSAAMFMESYGSPQGRALTRASRAFYERPPAGFTDVPLLRPRGVVYVARDGQQPVLDRLESGLQAAGTRVQRIDARDALAQVPILRQPGLLGAVVEAQAMDIDVHALLQGYLRGARAAGAALWCNAALHRAERDAGVWTVRLADGHELRTRTVVNAAGAWADDVAVRCGAAPLGLQPKRRSAFTFAAPVGIDARHWPAVVDAGERWYFKPDAGQLLGSPANADPVPAHDVVAEELDIATGIAAIETATTASIRRPTRTWAGLRTFAPDGEMVIGWDARREGFFWLAGQGGWGIQSAYGTAQLAAALVRRAPLPEPLQRFGVDPDAIDPARRARPAS